jgi:hypothetical protein
MRISSRLRILALRVLTLVILAVLTCPTSRAAETATRVYKIGFLGQTSATDLSRQLGALRQGLRDLAYEEGRNLANIADQDNGKSERRV